MSIAYLDVSSQLLKQILNLPEDAEIHGSSNSQTSDFVRLLVEHPSITRGVRQVNAQFKKIGTSTVFDGFTAVEIGEGAGR